MTSHQNPQKSSDPSKRHRGIDLDGPEPTNKVEREVFRRGRRVRNLKLKLSRARADLRQANEALNEHWAREERDALLKAAISLEQAGVSLDDLAQAIQADDQSQILRLLASAPAHLPEDRPPPSADSIDGDGSAGGPRLGIE